jgi:molybdenum cofactor biosynthesis protein MoaC
MVDISSKEPTSRTAMAVSTICFSNPTALSRIKSARLKKGDVLSTARVAGIMAAKRTGELIPLCHPIALTHVAVELELLDGGTESSEEESQNARFGGVQIQARVECEGKTGVEMEALMAASVTALTVYDMCKAVDKHMRIEGTRVVLKKGGKSGTWREEGFAGG